MESVDFVAFLRGIFAQSTLMAFTVNKGGEFIFANDAMMKVISSYDLKGRKVKEILPQVAEKCAEVLTFQEPSRKHEFSMNGVWYVGDLLPILWDGDQKNVIGLFWKPSDQDDLMKEMAHYKQKAGLLDIVFACSYDGLWIMDGGGKVLRVNRGAEKIAGIKAQDVMGKSVKEMEEKKLFDRSVTLEVLRRKTQVTLIQTVKGKKKVLLTGTPVFDDHQRIKYVVVNDRDITELINLKEQLEEAKALSNRYCNELKVLQMKNLEGVECVFRSLQMRRILETISRVSEVDSTVLLLGESGVGKGMIARMIHKLSSRKKGPFINVSCVSIPETLIESELFGFEKGAFTGAYQGGKPGFLELANGGTLFLDEIGAISLNTQVKLLQFLESQEIFRVGGTKPIKLDVRFVAAANKDLKKMIRKGSFREDLFYRLNVVPIYISPLRERTEDITALAKHFIDKFNKQFNRDKVFSSSVIDFFSQYHFPGNIRELSNLVERLVVITKNKRIEVSDLPKDILNPENVYSAFSFPPGKASLKEMIGKAEMLIVKDAIRRYGSQRKAAKALNVNQSTLVRKVKKYGICTRVISHSPVH